MSQQYYPAAVRLAILYTLFLCLLGPGVTHAADTGALARLKVEHVHYRPARWNTQEVREYEAEYPNEGGLLYFYLRNISNEPVDLRYWRYNHRDESFWILNHLVSWHRLYASHLAPGQLTVLEVCAKTRDFSPRLPFHFAMVDGTWQPAVEHSGQLTEETLWVSWIRVLPDMKELEVHVRNNGADTVKLKGLSVEGHAVAELEWRQQELDAREQSIARVRLAAPISSASLLVVSIDGEAQGLPLRVFAHRRAFRDQFPIGTWDISAGVQPFLQENLVDTGVISGRRTDPFFASVAEEKGLNAIVHTGEPVQVDMVRDLSGHPAVRCWMLRDEPDWSIPPLVMLSHDTTVRAYDTTIPTMINLCRNTKFFEYAPIPDIAGHDHYCVTAPSSSIWPHPYGTRLEETAYYTEDLKYASAPRPIWVWSQGNHDGWSERPQRPVPTPAELSVQLVLNLSRGAKGILWFTYNPEMSEKYPETQQAMRRWNQAMQLLKEDMLSSERVELEIDVADKVDVSLLQSWDTLLLCVSNLDYDIHPLAYPFRERETVTIAFSPPQWYKPSHALAFTSTGSFRVPIDVQADRVSVTLPRLEDAALVVLKDTGQAVETLEARYQELEEK